MLAQSRIRFLQDKILELRSALFFSMSDAVLKMPTTVVSALKVDEVGQVWFFTNRPIQQIQEFDREFPARLDFFRKGKKFFLKVTGKACIVNDPEEIVGLVSVTEDVKWKALHELVLVKLKISHVHYYENDMESAHNWFGSLKVQLNRWIHGSQPAFRPLALQG